MALGLECDGQQIGAVVITQPELLLISALLQPFTTVGVLRLQKATPLVRMVGHQQLMAQIYRSLPHLRKHA
jgi:hypothetical protein